MLLNVYDFDRTVYTRDSSIEFFKHILRRYSGIGFKVIPYQMYHAIKYALSLTSKEDFKSAYFSFLKYVKTPQTEVKEFVEKEIHNIAEWYTKMRRPDDVFISASPEFLVRAFAEKLGVSSVIASQVDIETGRFLGKNCYGAEKLKRYIEAFPNDKIDRFYTDSESDMPLAEHARIAYIVKKNVPKKWELK